MVGDSADVRNLKNIFHPENGFRPSGWLHFTCPGCGAPVETRFKDQGTCGKPECEFRLITVHLPEIRIRQLEEAVRKGLARNRSNLIRDILAAGLDAMQSWPAMLELPPAGGEEDSLLEVRRRKWTPPVRAITRREQIYQFVRHSNGKTPRDVAEYFDISSSLASRYLRELVDQKQLVTKLQDSQNRRGRKSEVYFPRQTIPDALGWQNLDSEEGTG